MISAKIFKLDYSGLICSNNNCKHNPEHHYNIIGEVFHIKQGVICLQITLLGIYEIYCRDCIDIVYYNLKPVLDSKLWVFY